MSNFIKPATRHIGLILVNFGLKTLKQDFSQINHLDQFQDFMIRFSFLLLQTNNQKKYICEFSLNFERLSFGFAIFKKSSSVTLS